MKLECSSQRIPCAVVLGLFELNCHWLRIPTSQKSFSGSGSQTLLSDDLGDKKFYAKGLELLHVVFNVIEKCGPVFLLLVFASLYKDADRKTQCFFAYAISRK